MNFVFDIDGTICFDYRSLSDDAMILLDDLEQRGHTVLFASARPIRDMLPVLTSKYADHTLIGGNGSIISKNGKITDVCLFDSSLMNQIKALLDASSAIYLADGKWDFHYNGDGSHDLMQYVNAGGLGKNVLMSELHGVMKLIIFEADNMDALLAELALLPLEFYRHPTTGTVDLKAFQTSKHDALKRINVIDYIAMGNDVNDIEMLAHARVGIMINENENLAPFASHQVLSDDRYLENIYEIINPYL